MGRGELGWELGRDKKGDNVVGIYLKTKKSIFNKREQERAEIYNYSK